MTFWQIARRLCRQKSFYGLLLGYAVAAAVLAHVVGPNPVWRILGTFAATVIFVVYLGFVMASWESADGTSGGRA
ncbi:hypothetical protein ABZ901_02615 [Actinacidiphila alni]|uniref:hypothetical protein n=1 Tax=Actinacidiphila alni TaxID=380248 RepID=UPI0033D586C6